MNYQLTSRKTYAEELQALREQFELWKVFPFSVDPSAVDRRKTWWGPNERGVTVNFEKPKGNVIRLTLDTQARPVDNLRVLTLGIEALRKNELRGIGEIMRSAYLQIEGPKERPKMDPWQLLGLAPNAPRSVVDAAYRARAKELHPDTGGDILAFKELQEAYEAVKGS